MSAPRVDSFAQMGITAPAVKVAPSAALLVYSVPLPQRIVLNLSLKPSVSALRMGSFAQTGFTAPAVKVAPSAAPQVSSVLLLRRIVLTQSPKVALTFTTVAILLHPVLVMWIVLAHFVVHTVCFELLLQLTVLRFCEYVTFDF